MPDDFHSFQAECAVAHQRTPAARRSTATVGGGATGGRRPTGPEGTSVAFGAGADVCTGGGTATRVGIGGGVGVRVGAGVRVGVDGGRVGVGAGGAVRVGVGGGVRVGAGGGVRVGAGGDVRVGADVRLGAGAGAGGGATDGAAARGSTAPNESRPRAFAVTSGQPNERATAVSSCAERCSSSVSRSTRSVTRSANGRISSWIRCALWPWTDAERESLKRRSRALVWHSTSGRNPGSSVDRKSTRLNSSHVSI